MELIERDFFLDTLKAKFEIVRKGEGHCVFISGEAGIGKTSLVKAFCEDIEAESQIYLGSCDALFTPRPMAPLYDVAMQIQAEGKEMKTDPTDRAEFFTDLFRELTNRNEPVVLFFEDIHWADEATLDFIKFLSRRISKIRCLFILTFRDDEIHTNNHLRNLMGQLSRDSFSRLMLAPLSRQAVERLAGDKGYSGEEVYAISGGNPFYVNEILASYSPGIPENIRDSILSVYHDLEDQTQKLWQQLSILPSGLEVKYLLKLDPHGDEALQDCMGKKVLIVEGEVLKFKHELYRRTIENALSPLLRIKLNKRILELLKDSYEANNEMEKIVHHSKNANEYEWVVHYAPLAARKAAGVGAHFEAAKLYYSAIEYYQGKERDKLKEFYESYAYECYLTNQIRDAIIYQAKALAFWEEERDTVRTGDCMRFLSRLWWLQGDRKQSEHYAHKAIEVMDQLPASKAKGMAFSNMAQLKMLSNQREAALDWGGKAIEMARELEDDEILCHALNNVGTIQQDAHLLQESMDIALKHSFHEHVARAYANLVWISIRQFKYAGAASYLDEGIRYCEEIDLDSWTVYMMMCKAKLLLETGDWNEAFDIAERLLSNDDQTPVVAMGARRVLGIIKMRRGEGDALTQLDRLKARTFQTREPERIIPAISALLEYEWISGEVVLTKNDLDQAFAMLGNCEYDVDPCDFSLWLLKARQQTIPEAEALISDDKKERLSILSAGEWEKLGRPYAQAMSLFEGSVEDKKKAIAIVQGLGASRVYEKMKAEMRGSGIRQIPRGLRRSTMSNGAQLTNRELDILELLRSGMQNKEIAGKLYISAKTVDHHISAILFKLDVNSRVKAVQEARSRGILK